MATKNLEATQVNNFLNAIISNLNLKNDAALAKALDVMPPVISKFRAGVIPFGAVHIIRAHELTLWTIAEIKAQLPAPKKRGEK